MASLLESVPLTVQLLFGASILCGLLFAYNALAAERPIKGIPIVALPEKGLGPKASWFKQGKATVLKGMAEHDGLFQILSHTGPKIVLPNRFVDEIRNNNDLSFDEFEAKEFFPSYPGFEGFAEVFRHDSVIQETIRSKLTQSLGLVMNDLVDETNLAVHDYFGEDEQWHTIKYKQHVLTLVARVSSRVFLGKELCRNERWLQISKDWTVDSFVGSRILHLIPSPLRPVLHWVLPQCIRMRRAYRDTKALIMPEIQHRLKRAQALMDAGKKPPKTADAIGWMYEVARARHPDSQPDYAAGQLALSAAAIHTTTEAVTQTLLHLCAHPKFFQPLRDEIIQVIGAEGWSKTAMYKLRLMDSMLKECQRLTPASFASMFRTVMKDTQLSDGTTLKAGYRIMVAPRYADPAVYEHPETFDPYRFVRKREEPGQNNHWQHVTTSAEHLGFGHGMHACPGRFFASNEIKVILVHLLMKYDWRFDDQKAELWELEAQAITPPDAKMQLRRRKEEIGLALEDGTKEIE